MRCFVRFAVVYGAILLSFLAACADVGATSPIKAPTLTQIPTALSSPSCSRSGAGYSDGCASQPWPGVAPNNSSLFSCPGCRTLAVRPPWDVAGVDYYVGHNPNGTHIDWTQDVPTGWTLVGGTLRCTSSSAADTISGRDFMKHAGGGLLIVSGDGCGGKTITISDNIMGCDATNSSFLAGGAIRNTDPTVTLNITANSIDPTKCSGLAGSAWIYSDGPTTITFNATQCSPLFGGGEFFTSATTTADNATFIQRYNYHGDCVAAPGVSITAAFWSDGTATYTTDQPHGIRVGSVFHITGVHPSGYNGTLKAIAGTTGTTINVSMSMPGSYRSGGVVAEVHMNLQQWTNIGTNVAAVVEFNTKYQTSVLGAELWQFYANFSGRLATASLKNNTIVAPPHGRTNVLSYPLHGGPVGSGTLCDNYFFGVSEGGMFGAMYPGSLTRAQGWTGSCPSGKPGVNMTSGAPINPK